MKVFEFFIVAAILVHHLCDFAAYDVQGRSMNHRIDCYLFTAGYKINNSLAGLLTYPCFKRLPLFP